jgi:hypothetical protein
LQPRPSHTDQQRQAGKHPSRGSIFRSSYPAIERVATHPRFDEISFILNDFLEVEGHAFDAESMERILISRVGSRYTNPRIRVMLVTTNESLFALADVTKPGASPATNETKGFSSVDEAKA